MAMLMGLLMALFDAPNLPGYNTGYDTTQISQPFTVVKIPL